MGENITQEGGSELGGIRWVLSAKTVTYAFLDDLEAKAVADKGVVEAVVVDSLRGVNGPKKFGRLVDILLKLRRLKVLELKSIDLKEESYPHLERLIRGCQNLLSLAIYDYEMPVEAYRVIGRALERNTSLSSCFLGYGRGETEPSDDLILPIIKAIRTNAFLEFLVFEECIMSADFQTKAAQMLKHNKGLRRFNFVLGDEPTFDIAQSLKDILVRNENHYRANFVRNLGTESKGKWNRSKLMFIGQGRAGKTSTVNALLGKKHEDKQESTVGASVEQTQTSSTQADKWRRLEKTDPAFLGQGMEKSTAVANAAAVKVLNDKEQDLRRLHGEEKAQQMKDIEQNNYTGGGQERNEPAPAPVPDTVEEGDDEPKPVIQKTNFNDRFMKEDKKKVDNLDTFGNLFSTDAFDGKEEDESAKMYANQVFSSAENTKDTLTFSLWDYGGQSVFYSLHHLFLTQYGVYILCFDMQEVVDESKRGAAKEYLEFWVNSVSLHAPSAPILLVGTHRDVVKELEEHLLVNDFIVENFKQKFPQVVCYLRGLSFYPVNNKDEKREGIPELRRDLERISREQEFVTADIPLQWIVALDMLLAFKVEGNTPNWMTLDNVKEIFDKTGIKSDIEVDRVLDLFHELGVLVRLKATQVLSKYVILNPQWLLDGLCKVIRDKKWHFDKGFKQEAHKARLLGDLERMFDQAIATTDLIHFLWSLPEYKDHQEFFLDLMKYMVLMSDWNFDGETAYLVPSLLTPKPENIEELELLVNQETTPGNAEQSEADTEEEIKEIEESEEKSIEHYAVFDFSKKFLPLGVFQRIVCLCVSYSTSLVDTQDSDKVKAPKLFKTWARISLGPTSSLVLEQKGACLYLSVTDSDLAEPVFRALSSMLVKLNNDLMAAGLEWDVYFKSYDKTVLTKRGEKPKISRVETQKTDLGQAKADSLAPWFQKEEKANEEAAALDSYLADISNGLTDLLDF